MAKFKDNLYKGYQTLIKDKDKAVNHYINKVLNTTCAMFEYSGLPDTLPQFELEKILQTNGVVGVTRHNGNLYAFQGALGGVCDAYNNPQNFIVNNPWLNVNKTYTVDKDVIIIKNTPYISTLTDIIGQYAVLLTDANITLNMCSILSRITMLISASDDKTQTSAQLFLDKILKGDFSIIGENSFFKGVTLQTPPTASNTQMAQLMELIQYYKASMYNELGVNANFNMKRERLNTQEVSANTDVLLPFVDSMLKCRVDGVTKVNKMFGTNITVELGSVWKLSRENYLSWLNIEREQHAHEQNEDMITNETVKNTETNETTKQ